jgi:outer membrane receptor protein involved in Fe transport
MKKTSAMPGKKLPACLVLVTLMSHQTLWSQTTPPAPSTANQPAATAPVDEEVIELSPFTITADKSNSYSALNTTSVTRFRTELAKLPVSADVFTETFMDDVGAVSIDQMIVDYGTGTGIGGANAAGNADQGGRSGDIAGNINIKIRGLDAGSARVNSFGQGGISDRFYIERADIVRGPQSLLNGGVGGGGVVNQITKQARFNSNSRNIEFRTDSEGSLRGVLDVGYGSRRVAIRSAIMMQDQRFSRIYVGNKSQGYYTQLAFQLSPNLIIRVEGLHSPSKGVRALNGQEVAFANTSDPRHNKSSRLLLAQGLLGDVAGGGLNWDNIDSVHGTYNGDKNKTTRYETTVEHKIGKYGALQLAAMYSTSDGKRTDMNNDVNILQDPARGGWVWGFNPAITSDIWTRRGYRANFATDFEIFDGKLRNQILLGSQYETTHNLRESYRYYLVDPTTDQIRVIGNPVGNTQAGRTRSGIQYFSLNNGPIGYSLERYARRLTLIDPLTNVPGTYELAPAVFVGATSRAPNNPLGIVGDNSASFWDQNTYNYSNYLAMTNSWFEDRFTTLLGYRTSENENKRYQQTGKRFNQTNPNSLNLGINFRLTQSLRPYYSYSKSFLPPDIVQYGPYGELTRDSTATGQEFGIKFDPKGGIFSGSLSYFTVNSLDEAISIETAQRQRINQNGMNGEREPTQNWINVDRKSSGVELRLTAQVSRNLRSTLGAAITDGKVGETVKYQQLNNDRFHEWSDPATGTRYAIYADGQTLAANSTSTLSTMDPFIVKWRPPGTPAGTSTNLTVDAIRANVSLDANNGRILTGGASGTVRTALTTDRAGVPGSASANRAFTGPIENHPRLTNNSATTSHQLGWLSPFPNGEVELTREGEPTTGYAKYNINWTNNYDFTNDLLRGFSVGGTVFYRLENRLFNYTDQADGNKRKTFYLPESVSFNLGISYKKRISKKIEWTSRLNVANIFNNYQVVLLPDENTGQRVRARFSAEPRTWSWTNSLSF